MYGLSFQMVPAKLMIRFADKLGVSDFLDNLGDSAEYKVAAGGISNIKDKIIEYAQNFFDKFNEENGGGSFDGAMADNVYKYLVDIANQAVRKFGMSGITSGFTDQEIHIGMGSIKRLILLIHQV